MINNELIDFVRAQLQANVSRDQIIQSLKDNGWTDVDISEAFSHINNNVPNQTFSQNVQNISLENKSFKNPKVGNAFLYAIIAIAISVIGTFLTSEAKTLFPNIGIGAISIFILVLLISFILMGFVLFLTTRIIKTPIKSFAKALTFSSLSIVVAVIISLILQIVSIPGIIILLLGLAISIGLMKWYYDISILKSIGIFFLNLVFSFVFGIIIYLIAGAVMVGVVMGIIRGTSSVDLGTNNQMINQEMSIDENTQGGDFMDFEQENSNQTEDSNIDDNEALSLAQIKTLFPTGFPFPADSKITFEKDKQFSKTYNLKYTVSGNMKTIISEHESLFKKASYDYVKAMSSEFGGVLVADKGSIGKGMGFRIDFLSEKAGIVQVDISMHEF